MKLNIRKIKSQLSEELRREARIRMRIKAVTIGVGIGFAIVAGRAVELHSIKDSSLNWVANKQYNAKLPQSSRRGRILDRAGKELAVSLPVPSIYADPSLVSLTGEERSRLAELLSMSEKDLSAKLNNQRKFVWLKRRVDPAVAEAIKGLQGIYSIEESRRFYPNGELASHVLGAVGLESEALAGIELSQEKFLASQKREAVYRRDARGKFYFSPVAYDEQDDVDDVYLTIDKQIQFVTENALKKAAETANARGGTAIVVDISTGAVLAMANMPAFDSNNYSKFAQDTWRNRAITDTIEPGSTFKVLIVSSALDAGVVTPEQMFDCEMGAITVGNATLHDHNPYGRLSVRDIIKVSSNIGALKVAREMGNERVFEYLKRFGIGNRTGIDYPGEVGGIVRPASTWQPVELGTIAFGQGISVTPIQMAAAFASIANGGRLMRPYVIDRIVNNQGITLMRSVPTVVSQAIREETAKTMIGIIEGVVTQGGTGTKAASKEYTFAGKTGTAQKVTEGSGRYAAGKYYASFVGFAPSNEPKIAIFVGLDEPKGAYYGGAVSAPVFKEIAEAALKYLSVPSALSRVVTASNVSEGGVLSTSFKEQKMFQKISRDGFEVPDLRGATMRDVAASIGQANIRLKVEGSGLLVDQSPAPGGVIKEGEMFLVSFKQPE